MKLFQRKEHRNASQTDEIVQLLVNAAAVSGVTALPNATAAAEICAGIIQRAFSSATISGAMDSALTPDTMGYVGRRLALYGECMLLVESGGLYPVTEASMIGGFRPQSWRYTVTLPGPSETTTFKELHPASVLHFRWGVDQAKPWRGRGPLQLASLDARLLAEIVKHLGDEATMPRGSFLPMPKTGGADASVELLKRDINSADGSILLVESMADAWQAGGRTGNQFNSDWGQRRFGANPPEPLIKLYEMAHNNILSAFGLSAQMFSDTSNAAREAWRVALFGLIKPLSNMISGEIEAKTGSSVAITFDELRASDLQGRARAFKSMVDAGLDIAEAKRLSGF